MKLSFNTQLADNYKNPSQKARILTEEWVENSIFCPSCGESHIEKYPNNQPATDFYCPNCNENYELKSKQGSVGSKIVDGAYHTMVERLKNHNNPSLFVLNYDLKRFTVLNFIVIPKHFFVPEIVQKRKALSPTARRAGWVGCNILLNHIPQTGKIFLIRDGLIESKEKVLADWKKTLFLRDKTKFGARGWLLDTMLTIDKIDRSEFSLHEIYAFEKELRNKYPNNRHIKDKLRQQLQILRDKGYIEFTGRGNYRIISSTPMRPPNN